LQSFERHILSGASSITPESEATDETTTSQLSSLTLAPERCDTGGECSPATRAMALHASLNRDSLLNLLASASPRSPTAPAAY
jgi:hypothetical protein